MFRREVGGFVESPADDVFVGRFFSLVLEGPGTRCPFRVDEARQALVGARGRTVIRMGDALKVRLLEANPLTGSMIFEPLNRKKGGKPGKKTSFKNRKGAKRKRRPS